MSPVRILRLIVGKVLTYRRSAASKISKVRFYKEEVNTKACFFYSLLFCSHSFIHFHETLCEGLKPPNNKVHRKYLIGLYCFLLYKKVLLFDGAQRVRKEGSVL